MVDVPAVTGARSDLDGYRMVAITTEPEENLRNFRIRAQRDGLHIVGVHAQMFAGKRFGYLVVVHG